MEVMSLDSFSGKNNIMMVEILVCYFAFGNKVLGS